MNIALLGYGKMGHEIEKVALDRGHCIVTTIDNEEEWNKKSDALSQAQVAIDFSVPSQAVANMRKCFNRQLPVVVGTTGWYDQLNTMIEECNQHQSSLFVASNFSIGVNILFELNRRLAQLMNQYNNYNASITETHHIHKLDAPSGTAITLANDIVNEMQRLEKWTLCTSEGISSEGQLPITAIRKGEVPGIHEICYESEVDTLTLSHSAKSRKGFAIGAVLAAEYLQNHSGYHTMKDLLIG